MPQIKTSAFCGLSRSADWQAWLKNQAPDLHTSLMETVNAVKGCRANSNKMMDIYFELNKRGLEKELSVFLKRRFPWILEGSKDKSTIKKIKKNKIAHDVKNLQTTRDWNQLNKHKVFQMYRPDILSFPQKLIMVGDNLYDRIQDFAKTKLAVDYIIIEDRAYIEYFDAKYSTVIDKIPRSSRDIYKYRLKMRQQNAE